MVYFLSIFWFIRQTKAILFWVYLLQLKEYHIGRFLDHFRTEKGKYLLFNPVLILKIIFIFLYVILWRSPLFYFSSYLFFFVFILYFFESAKAFFDFFRKKLKKPVFTKKIIFLTFVSFALTIFYLFVFSQKEISFLFWLLLFDILTPAIVSGIVLCFQPLIVLLRNQIIKKAKEKREKFKDILVIGITGSYGKTSTKEFLYTILSEKFGEDRVLKTKEHQNSEIGISQCILEELKPEHQIFVCEMGAYNRGGIKLLCDIARPKIGILTGINEQHMATFGSQENIIKTKFELIESLPEDGIAIFNWDDKKIQNSKFKIQNYNLKLKIKFCSTKEKIDIWAEYIQVEREFISFKVFSNDGNFADFKVNLLGAQNISNILAATCCAKELGMNLEEISKACQKLKPLAHQMELKKGINDLNIIDTTYSANPDGIISHLEYLKIWEGKKVIVMPCLIELAKASKEVHKRIGKKIAEVCDLAIITTKDRFKEIKETAGEKTLFIENPKKIFKKIKNFCQKDDVILLEGRVANQLIDLLIIS